jgi:tetratricopeptide (TPR) repeat protein
MPPWKPEPGYGVFADARRLDQVEVELLQQWVAAGAPEGDGSPPHLPPSTRENPWRLGTPDLIISMPRPYRLRPDGGDMYRNFVVPIPLAEKRYVRAWEFRPSNRTVHHATLHVDSTETSLRFDREDPEPGYEGLIAHSARTPDGFFLDWGPGHTPFELPSGIAWPIEKDSSLVMMLHLRPSGKPEDVQASVGLYFSDHPPSRTPVMIRLTRQDLDLSPGESRYTAMQTYTVPVDVDVYTVQPHAHYLARSIKVHAELPDGRTEPLIFISDWAFDWQDVYRYEKPVFLPAGTRITMEWQYDNSRGNPRNPHEPPRRVTYGQRTSDEMAELWLQVVTRTTGGREILTRSVRVNVLPQEIAGHEMMVRADPDNITLRDDLALLYVEARDISRAAIHFAESLRVRPQSPAANYNLGTALVALGSRGDAAKYLQAALELNQNYGRAHLALGSLYQSEARYEEAAKHYLEALQINSNSPDAVYGLGVVLRSQPRDDEAVAHIQRALRSTPDSAPGLLALAWILATSSNDAVRQPDEAVRLAERAVVLGGDRNPVALDILAAACASVGQFARAVKLEQTALELTSPATNEVLRSAFRGRLTLYRSGKPYRQ